MLAIGTNPHDRAPHEPTSSLVVDHVMDALGKDDVVSFPGSLRLVCVADATTDILTVSLEAADEAYGASFFFGKYSTEDPLVLAFQVGRAISSIRGSQLKVADPEPTAPSSWTLSIEISR